MCVMLDPVSYAGDITALDTWQRLVDDPEAVLVDVRTRAEWTFVGVADLASLGREVVYVEWNRIDGTHNERFVEDLQAAGVTPGDRPVFFLCRSGNRSVGAAEVATAAGIAPAYNVSDGFEGEGGERRERTAEAGPDDHFECGGEVSIGGETHDDPEDE